MFAYDRAGPARTRLFGALTNEDGSQMPGFIAVAVLAGLVALGLSLASSGLRSGTQYAYQNAAARTVAQNVCTVIYAFGLESGTNTRLRSFAGGTESIPYPIPSATPISVHVTVGAASGGQIPVYATAGASTQQTMCTIPNPKPAYGSTSTAP